MSDQAAAEKGVGTSPRPVRRRPRPGRPARLLHSPWTRLLAGALALACGLCGLLTAYAALTLPPLADIGRATGTIRILDRHGRLVAELSHDARSRHSVALAQVSPWLVRATVSTEDRGFYDEGALNLGRVARALFVDVLARRPSQGASTITQQLAKLAFLSSDRSAMRKLREALLASEIDRAYGKDEILAKYLNLIDYGAGATGIEDAAHRYFGKPAGDLDLRESALLAGLPQAPSTYDPYENPTAAWGRMHVVVVAMLQTGAISTAQAAAVDPLDRDARHAAANQKALLDDLRHGQPLSAGAAPHFAEYVREQLERRLGGDPLLTQGSLEVTTTLDLDLQRRAQEAVTAGVRGIGRNADNGALLMLDAPSGDVLAMVGSASFDDAAIDGQFNVTTGLRQPGSTFKPFVYATAFAEGRLSPSSRLDDSAAESQRLGGVQDEDRAYLGRISAAQALLQSRNIPAEQAMAIAGTDNVITVAQRLGVGTPIAANLSSAIGTSAVHMTDHAAAFAGLARGGVAVGARAILRVVDADGGVLVDEAAPHPGTRVLPSGAVDAVTRILRGEPREAGVPMRYDVAAKTGTTDNDNDAWYAAYTPDWVVDAWVGHSGGAQPAGMVGVAGVDTGRSIVAPFVATLAPPHRFDDSGAPRCPDGSRVPVGIPLCPQPGD